MRIVFVGHVCVDTNVVRGEEQRLYGGGVVHGSITARRLGASPVVITKCTIQDHQGFRFLSEAGVELQVRTTERSTCIRNVYPSDNPDDRQSFLLDRAEAFDARDLEELTADIVHVNPLSAGEFPEELLPVLRSRAPLLALDAQGFVRHADGDGRLAHGDWTEKERYLPLLDLLKVDQREAQVLTGLPDAVEAARKLVALGARTVLLTHKTGLVAATPSAVAEAAFGAYALEGRTGRGDTCTAAFLVGRKRLSLPEAARYAAEVTTRKMQYAGPFRG